MSKTAKKKDDEPEILVVCRNRRAAHDYEITEPVECGIVLVGTEVKSLRDGQANLEDAYARVENGEVFLLGFEIPEYKMGNRLNHEPKRVRKLLLHRREIAKYAETAEQKGFTLIPIQVYFKNGRAKVEIAIGKGKQNYDKRQSLKKAEAKREMDRATVRRRK